MAGRGPAPAANRRRRNKPARGEWHPTPGFGWQHGPNPRPEREEALSAESIRAWDSWMASWMASHWTLADLAGLSVTIHLLEQTVDYQREPFIEKDYITVKGEVKKTWVVKPNPVSELRQLMDSYGLTHKGQQDRRWAPPKADEKPEVAKVAAGGKYAHLRAVG